MDKSEPMNNGAYGQFDLVLADSNGSNPAVYGRDFQWASWSPDGRQIACLLPEGIQIVDVASRQVVRTLPRQDIVQQMVWSPDGKAFTGVANKLGPYWNIACLPANGEKIRAVSETERFNCTPDWHPDGRHILYARGIIPGQPGRAELWMGDCYGREKTLLYAEEDRNIYGACASPDARYLLFTRSVQDHGGTGESRSMMAIIRYADTPMIGENSPALRQQVPNAKPACRLDLGFGLEPHWTAQEILQ
jgi:hypothetical protein